MRTVPALAAVLLVSCSGAPETERARMQLDRSAAALPEVSIDGQALDARAFASAASFLFPEQTRALVRTMLRSEFARREADRLALSVPGPVVDDAFEQAVQALEEGLPDGLGLEAWARQRYRRSWREVRGVLRRQILDNQLYQLAVRADAALGPRYACHLLLARDEPTAARWARQLRQGASPGRLAEASLDPGPNGDGSFPPLARYLPDPVRRGFEGAARGTVVGPFRLEGEDVWRVLRVREVLPGASGVPPVASLLDDLAGNPIGELEARAWFSEMIHRYTAAERLPALVPPDSAFVSRR